MNQVKKHRYYLRDFKIKNNQIYIKIQKWLLKRNQMKNIRFILNRQWQCQSNYPQQVKNLQALNYPYLKNIHKLQKISKLTQDNREIIKSKNLIDQVKSIVNVKFDLQFILIQVKPFIFIKIHLIFKIFTYYQNYCIKDCIKKVCSLQKICYDSVLNLLQNAMSLLESYQILYQREFNKLNQDYEKIQQENPQFQTKQNQLNKSSKFKQNLKFSY
ncbi:unnamed protein product [Paramecium sonneborni]|uniref:Uncharacterized protein n=1 Tax=Paramecium sonneborni TaxID=65129 RepID=A0A8S1KMW9_9CILI|nr:unnamed protein product [Paramecium sonneborni]